MKDTLRDEYRAKASSAGWGPVLDAGEGDGPKNNYLDFLHRRTLRKYAHLLGPRAVDLGCGIGRLTSLVAEERFTIGIDGSPDLLALARKRLGEGAALVQADLTSVPLQSGSMTGAVMAFVSLHFDDAAAVRAFSEVARVLQPGGHFLLMEHASPGEPDRDYHGVTDRTRASIERHLRTGGLEPALFVALKKSPSRVVHWVKQGKLPRSMWGFGAWLDAKACGKRVDLADYVECLVIARKPGVGLIEMETPSLLSLFVPRRLRR